MSVNVDPLPSVPPKTPPLRVGALIVLASLLAVGWLLLAAIGPFGVGRILEYPTIGYFFGTMFGLTTLGATWAALGPLSLLWRLPLSLAWLAATMLAVVANISMHGPGPDAEVIIILSGCILAQWVLVQLLLWPLALWYGLQIRSPDAPARPLVRQFAIRQLMILTAVVAVVLGMGRALSPWLLNLLSNSGGDPMIIAFLFVASVVLTVPLVLAALLPRWAVLASLAILLLIAIATAGELSLFQLLPTRGGGPDFWHFAWINGFSAAWVLAVIGLLRLAGYRIADAATQANPLANSR